MDFSRRYVFLSALIFCAALPAILAYVIYVVTQNPTYRPLGLTKQQLVLMDGTDKAVAIRVTVDWGLGQGPDADPVALRDLITEILFTYTDDFIVSFRETPGDSVGVTFRVGPNSYGPMPPDQMMNGMVPALMALDMTQKARH